MKQIFITLLALGFFSVSIAQEKPTIEVLGTATVGTAPTETIVSMQLNSKRPTYASVIEDLNKRSNILQKDLQKLGFDEKEIITLQYNIRKNTVYERGTARDDGYIATQTLKVRFKNDSKKLVKTINGITSSTASAEISMFFEIDSETRENLQKELLKLAVQDAQEKAGIIASTTGYLISGIQKVDYQAGNRVSPYRAGGGMELAAARVADASSISNIQADDIMLNDEVTVIFEIQKQ